MSESRDDFLIQDTADNNVLNFSGGVVFFIEKQREKLSTAQKRVLWRDLRKIDKIIEVSPDPIREADEFAEQHPGNTLLLLGYFFQRFVELSSTHANISKRQRDVAAMKLLQETIRAKAEATEKKSS